MGFEYPRGREFAKFVSHHVFSYIYGNEALAVMDAECVSNKVGCDCRTTGPGLYGLLCARFHRFLDFLEQMVINEESFLNGTSHGARGALIYLRLRGLRPLWWTIIILLESFVRRRVT